MTYGEVNSIPSELRPRSRQAEMSATALGLEALDLEAAGPFTSELFDLRGHFVYTIYSEVDRDAATTGDFSVFLDLYDRSADNIVESIELWNSQSSASDNTVKCVFGEGVDPAIEDAVGTSGAQAGSRMPNAKLNFLARLRVVNDTPADDVSELAIRMHVGD